jgi:hypothetical protein
MIFRSFSSMMILQVLNLFSEEYRRSESLYMVYIIDAFIILKISEGGHSIVFTLQEGHFYEKRRFRKSGKYDIIQNSMIY